MPVVRFHNVARNDDLTQEKADQLFERRHPGLKQAISDMADGPSYELRNAPRARRVWVSGTNHTDDTNIGLADEGLLHRCVYIAAAGKGRAAFDDVIARLPRPDILVLVTVPFDVARKRYIWRMPTPDRREAAARRFDKRTEDHKRAPELLERGMEFYRRHNVTTQVFDNSGSIDGKVAGFAAQIATRLQLSKPYQDDPALRRIS